MKKIFLIIVIGLLLSGCKVKYELNIDENYAHFETITINGKSTELGLSNLDALTKLYLNDDSLYTVRNKSNNGGNYNVLIDSSMGEYDVYRDSLALSYFYNLGISKGINKITYTYKAKEEYNQDTINLNNIDGLEIVLNSVNPVIESNAEKVDNGKYYWSITDELKDITFTIDYSNQDKDSGGFTDFLEKNDINPNYLGLVGLVIIAGVIVGIVIKSKNRNRI